MKIYEALYCGCIYESSYATLSLHRTREGAEKAIAFSKMAAKKEFDELYQDDEPPKGWDWTTGKEWDIAETELKD